MNDLFTSLVVKTLDRVCGENVQLNADLKNIMKAAEAYAIERDTMIARLKKAEDELTAVKATVNTFCAAMGVGALEEYDNIGQISAKIKAYTDSLAELRKLAK